LAEQRLAVAPAGLGSPGRALWRRLVREYVFQAGQLELLKALCQTEDRLSTVRSELDGADLIVEGKMGSRAHPLLATERDLRATQLRIYRALSIHEDLEEEREVYDTRRRSEAASLGHWRHRAG